MNIPITILLAALAAIALTIGKALLVSRLIRDGQYSHRNLFTISLLFAALTAQSISSQCDYLGCGWSLRFTWVSALLRSVFSTNSVPDAQIAILTMAGYTILSIYFFGHLLGWVFHALSRTRSLMS